MQNLYVCKFYLAKICIWQIKNHTTQMDAQNILAEAFLTKQIIYRSLFNYITDTLVDPLNKTKTNQNGQ